MTTATEAPQAPVFTTFRERIKGLKRKELVEIAKDDFQLNVDEKIKDDVLKDLLMRCHEDRITTALEENQKASQVFLEANPKEQLLTIQFLPLDFPNNPLKFSYDGGYGIRNRKNPKKNLTGLSQMPKFFLIPGQIYQLPICVIKHLESMTCRDSKPEYDSQTGMIAGNIPIIKQRFMLRPILSDEAMANMGSRDFGKV